MAESHSFRLPNDLNEVPPLRARFVRACADAGVADEDMQASTLVFIELVNNSIEHGCKRAEDHVEGWYRITETDIEVEVTDPSEVLTEDDFTNSDASDFAENGRGAGLFLIHALSDEVLVHASPSGGTTIRIVKHRGRGAA